MLMKLESNERGCWSCPQARFVRRSARLLYRCHPAAHPLLLCLHLALSFWPVGAHPLLKHRLLRSAIVLHVHTLSVRLMMICCNLRNYNIALKGKSRTVLSLMGHCHSLPCSVDSKLLSCDIFLYVKGIFCEKLPIYSHTTYSIHIFIFIMSQMIVLVLLL